MMLVSLLVFQLQAQGWKQRADFGGTGRHRPTGFAIGNKGYVGFGHVNGTGTNIVYKDWWQYDPASNAWTQKADYTAAGGTYAAIAFATSTRGYVGGGTAYSYEYMEYNPVTNTWQAIANCPLDISDQTAFAVNDKGYVLSGNLCYEYNPVSNAWTAMANAPGSIAIWSTSFVIGSSGFVKTGNSLYEFKPSQNQWVIRNSCPGTANGGSSAFSIENKGYIISGYNSSLANVVSEVWEFNPANNTWQQMEDFPGAARRFSVGFAVNDRGYFGLGTNGINFNDFWAFDHFLGIKENNQVAVTIFPNPATDVVKWQLAANMLNTTSHLRVMNSAGELLIEQEFSGGNIELPIHEWIPGTYFYAIENSSLISPITGQFIKAGL
jgi:N-acetylneuraminic acid mutarotase